jgi:hypothetical protein
LILAVLFYVCLLALFLRVLPWVARRHPGARNLAALVVEGFAALGAANALALIATAWIPSIHRDAPALNALLASAFAVGAHYLGSGIATSPHPIYIPFVAAGILFSLAPRPISLAVGIGMIAIGLIAGFMKYRDLRTQRAVGSAREAPQA